MPTYLSTEEAASYLGIKERKLYELVATGGVPCSKVTGKWLFPQAALDRWIESGLAHPPGFIPSAPPPIIGGSHDPLLEWAARHSGSGLALLSEGSGAGLVRIDRNEVAMAALHMHGGEPGVDPNTAAVEAMRHANDIVVIGFARREQGLLVAPGNPLGLLSLADVATRQARLGQRQGGAGAQLLLVMLASQSGLRLDQLPSSPGAYATGQDLAFAIRSGVIDCGIATRAVAASHGLGFAPLIWEHFDLVMRRRVYFEPGPQKLLQLMREPEFHRHASLLGGYDTAAAGAVRFNR